MTSFRATAPPLRILQAGSVAYQGGVTKMIKTLCAGLRRLGHEVQLFCDGGELADLQALGIRCHVTELWQEPGALLRSALQMGAVLRRFQPDVIHVHGRSCSLRSLLAGRYPDWFTLHNTHLTHQTTSYDVGRIRKLMSPFAHNFFVLDERARDYLQDEFAIPSSRVVRVHNGVDCSEFREPSAEERAEARAAFGVADDQLLLTFVGRLHPSKQPEAVIAAAQRAIQESRTDLRFAIVGDGELAGEMERSIAATGVGDVCKLYPWMKNPLGAYHAADLLLMPSQFEGFPLVGAEAMASGCPVLRTRTGGFAQMIQEGVTGFASDTSVDAFVTKLYSVLDLQTLRRMRPAARKWAVDHMNLEQQAETMAEHYRRVLRNAPSRHEAGVSASLLPRPAHAMVPSTSAASS